MRTVQLSLTPADDDLVGHASNVTGASWTIATTSAGDSMAHSVSIRNDSITDHSGKTALLTGTDADGNPQTETMALPGVSATVQSTKYFKTLTSIVPSATIGADTMDIGWTDDVVSRTIVPDFAQAPFNVGLGLIITGTINVDVQHTFDNVFGTAYATWSWLDHASLAAKTTSADGNYAAPVKGIRVLVNSLTAGATIVFTVIQGSR